MTDTNQVDTPKPTEADFVKKMEALYCEINILQEDIAQLKADAKDAGYKQAKLAKIAKLRADCKVGTFIDDVKDIINMIEGNNL